MKVVSRYHLAALAVALALSRTCAYGGLDPRGMAMSGASLVRSRGVEGALLNPASLGMADHGSFSIKLFYVGAVAGNNSFNLSDYNRMNGAFLGDGEKKALLRDIPASGFIATSEADALMMGISTGRLALTVNLRSAEMFHLPKDIFDLALFGNQLDRTYDLGARDMGEAWTVAATTVSYGQPFDVGFMRTLALGIGLKHLMGINYGKLSGQMNLTTTETGFSNEGNISILSAGEKAFDTRRPAMTGSGFAADVGLAGQITRHWSFGMSLMNLSSGITWTKDVRQRTVSVAADGITLMSLAENGVLDGESPVTRTDSSGGTLRSRYPATFSAGVAYESRYFASETDIRKGFYNGAGSSNEWQVMQGMEIRLLPFFPIRAGMAVMDHRTIEFSAGCGLNIGFIKLDLAATSLGLPGNGSKGIGAGVSASLAF